MSPSSRTGTRRLTPSFVGRLRSLLADETVSGMIVIVVAMIALLVANSPLSHAYHHLAHIEFGPASIGLHLSVHEWAADGLLTIFFFVVGLELKTEFVTGALRDMKEAALPMLAAAFGMIGPALLYVLVQAATGSTAWNGWAVPTATDIAFAVAILSLFGKGMPPTARTFLLTLAVVDDLLAIIVIAVFYSSGLNFLALAGALAVIAVFAVLVNRRITHWWLLIPLGVLAWALMLNSGVHATIAGVALGLVVPATRTRQGQMTHDFVEAAQPWSAGLALPVFAFFAAGVTIIGAPGGVASAVTDPVTIGIAVALPLGKLLGIWGSVAVLTRTTRLRLGHGVDLPDIAAIGLLAGIGFTVAMLIGGLAFTDETMVAHARFGVIIGTFAAALLGALALRMRLRVHARGSAPHRER
ncbi:Na+/H+ antiporter NhaA [Actinomyces sp. B33]|uniref:Na+/H+ antiporter NhaA n=1 Tax=Actinomyces sp. B33 TaxID=2942131 RepID=UPI002341C3D8|nr:Na+/H+ antiporter NhaA [Actinomyces sp. B33]MDC4232596.1 Na+/H+ antiporter NhaA [Actinomyces sp. B33]